MSTNKKKAEESQPAEQREVFEESDLEISRRSLPARNPGGFGGAGQEPADPYAHRKFIVHEKPHMALPKEKP